MPVDRGLAWQLMAEYAAGVEGQTFEHRWERDAALQAVVDRAVQKAGRRQWRRREPASSPPRWLRGLVRRELDASSQGLNPEAHFTRVRRLERLRLVEVPVDDTYVLAMVAGLGPGPATRLRADPKLVERALWRVFEVEGGGQVSLANVDRFGGDGWRRAFLELTGDGTLDRARVLDGCLSALMRDFSGYRAAWFSATFLALEPDVDELGRVQTSLRRLLGSSVAATVGFAMRLLQRLHRAGRLEADETLAVLAPVTLVKPKVTALAALRLARDLGPDPRLADIARSALGHPHGDVQRLAAELLADSGHGADVAAAADDFAPGVRRDLGFAAPRADPSPAAGQRLAPPPDPVTADELAERTAGLLEDCTDAAELEAVLAALVVPGADERLGSLRKRARTVAARGPDDEIGVPRLAGYLAAAVVNVLGEEPVPLELPSTAAQRFLVARMGELRPGSTALLATPDLPGGWLSPATLVARLAAGSTPHRHDLTAALLRLHPSLRAEADHPELPSVVRFALTGVRPEAAPGPLDWWRAAERSRGPYAEHEAPRLRGETKVHRYVERDRDRSHRYTSFEIVRPNVVEEHHEDPTAFDHGDESLWSWGDWVPSLASIWPHDAEHYLGLTSESVLDAVGWAGGRDVPLVIDSLARHPGRLGELAVHTLAAGLSAELREHRLHAVDAFVDLVPSGRIPAVELADVFARYAGAWKLGRWTESLREAGQAPGRGDGDRGPADSAPASAAPRLDRARGAAGAAP